MCTGTNKRELWRLRSNWVFVASLSLLATISNTSISSSFHQFVINPRTTTDDNSSWTTTESGLGQSEVFYSWLLAVFNFGSVFGAVVSGLLVHWLPYWHLFAVSLLAHIAGFTLYALTYQGGLVLLSKFLSGYFIGAQWSLAIGYTAKSCQEYVGMTKGAWPDNERRVEDVKRYVLSSHTVGVAIGFVVGPGVAVLFAQYPIDQFRAIAWYNIAMGTILLVLQLFLFRGEGSCRLPRETKRVWHCSGDIKKTVKNGYFGGFIIVTFLLFLVVAALRFAYFETLFNPVLSDSFGFDERDSSYYFLALALPYVGGVITLVALQQLALSNQLIAIVGIAMTFIACMLSADWQSILDDPCTLLSPFHHPELMNHPDRYHDNAPWQHTLYSDLSARYGLENITCTHTDHCNCKQQLCLNYTLDQNSLLLHETPPTSALSPLSLRCKPHTLPCVHLYSASPLTIVSTQQLTLLSHNDYNTYKRTCEASNVTGCHWIPSSSITHKECVDCQPICRGVSRTLTFWQFVLGTSIVMASLPLLWVSLVAMVSFQVGMESQGLLGGAIAAVNSAARGIGPLVLDRAYEGVQKRTFVAMLLLLILHFPILIEILILYRRLGPPEEEGRGPEKNGRGYKSVPGSNGEQTDEGVLTD